MEIKSERIVVDLKQEPIEGFYSINIYPNMENVENCTIEKVLNTRFSLDTLNNQFETMMTDNEQLMDFVENLSLLISEETSPISISPYVFSCKDFDYHFNRELLTQVCFFEEDLNNFNIEKRLLALDYRYNGKITPLTFVTFEALSLVRKCFKWSEMWFI